VVQIKVDDGGMCQAVTEDGVHDADVDVVDPAEAGRVGRGAVVAGRPDGDEGPLRPLRLEDGIDSVAHAAEGPLHGLE